MIARKIVAEFGNQVIGLALLCPVIIAESERRDAPGQQILRRDKRLIASLGAEDAEDYVELAVVQSQHNWELFRDHALPRLRPYDPRTIERISGRYALAVEPESVSPPFEKPTAIMAGRQDHVVGFSDAFAVMDHYIHATMTIMTIIDRAGHNAHLDQSDLIARKLDEWLLRITTPTTIDTCRSE